MSRGIVNDKLMYVNQGRRIALDEAENQGLVKKGTSKVLQEPSGLAGLSIEEAITTGAFNPTTGNIKHPTTGTWFVRPGVRVVKVFMAFILEITCSTAFSRIFTEGDHDLM